MRAVRDESKQKIMLGRAREDLEKMNNNDEELEM